MCSHAGYCGRNLTASAFVCVFHWLGWQRSDIFIAKTEPEALKSHTTALLWAMCPLAILILPAGAGDVGGGCRNKL